MPSYGRYTIFKVGGWQRIYKKKEKKWKMKMMKCPLCPEELPTRKALRDHMEYKHQKSLDADATDATDGFHARNS